MAYIYLPKLKKVPEGATKEERLRMFEECKKELVSCNPNYFNENGTQKTFLGVLGATFLKRNKTKGK